MDQWLVRTSQNLIAGPYTRDQVCQLVREGRLSSQDEFCPANGFWVSMHEHDEVKRVLGVEIPRTVGSDDEITETQMARPADGFASDFGDDSKAPESTAVLKRPAPAATVTASASGPAMSVAPPPSAPSPAATSVAKPLLHQPVVLGRIEKSSFARGFAWLLVAGLVAGVYFVFKLTRN